MKYFKYIYAFLFLLIGETGIAQKSPVDYVNIFAGTSNSRAMLGPYAGVPYGMVQLGPDNQDQTWMSGYEYSISNVLGFSHIHAWSMGGLLVMPAVQDFTKDIGQASSSYRGAGASFHSRMIKETEKASPGYYSCFLYDADCKAELTASAHCGFHKYTFKDAHDDGRIMIALNYPMEYESKLTDAKITKVTDSAIEGYAEVNQSYSWYTLYFSIRFNKPFNSFNGWNMDNVEKDVNVISGKEDVGAFVNYSIKPGDEIMMKVGISLVDIEGARKNLSTEFDKYGWDFDKAHMAARQEWNDLLSTIEVKGTELNKEKFYTNFYRSFAKQRWNDVDGRYRDPFENIQHLKEGVDIYGGDSFWNSYWSYNTVLSLVAPKIMNNWVNTQLELFDKTGWTNNGPTGLELTGVMEVTHEISLMVSAYQKGIRNYDVNKLYQAVKHNSMEQGYRLEGTGLAGMERLNAFKKYGYVPYEIDRASRTLDYSYTMYCAAQLAKAMGDKKSYKDFSQYANNWKNQFHPILKWQVPRDSVGNWVEDYNPFNGKHWIEGNGWQYTWYIPHDVQGVIDLMGIELFNQRLEEGFKKAEPHKFAAHVFDRAQEKPFEYYVNHGNEENLHCAFLFNYSKKPWLTQKYTRKILDSYYGLTPFHGWEGDEDEGMMSGWFVIASMGLFEMNGGVTSEPTFDLTSPLFDEIVIHFDNDFYTGKIFTIKANNNSPENIYIQSATFNGKSLKDCKLKFEDVVKGGELIFEMGSKPNMEWGI